MGDERRTGPAKAGKRQGEDSEPEETEARDSEDSESEARGRTEAVFGFIEDGFYVLIAATLAIAGAAFFGYSIYSFVTALGETTLSTSVLELLDNLLLLFIITEVIHTIRAIIDERIVLAEPFLIVGIVAAIRRLLVVSAEAKELLGEPTFIHAMLEVGILTAAALFLTLAVFFLRKTTKSEPVPAHEPG